MENFDSTFDFWKILIIGLEQFGPFYGNTGAVMEFQAVNNKFGDSLFSGEKTISGKFNRLNSKILL